MSDSQTYRKEIKYPLSLVDFEKIKRRFLPYVTLDPHCLENGYRVRSLYFDSNTDADLYDVLDGVRDKQKIRLRYYPPNDEAVLLENKVKSGTDGVKLSLSLTKLQAQQMMVADYSFLRDLSDPLALRLYARLMTGAYQPKSIVEYRRLAYIYPVSNTRITFDYSISASSVAASFFDQNMLLTPVTDPDMGVLEVKYDHLLVAVLKDALMPLDSLSSANSKYVSSRFIF